MTQAPRIALRRAATLCHHRGAFECRREVMEILKKDGVRSRGSAEERVPLTYTDKTRRHKRR